MIKRTLIQRLSRVIDCLICLVTGRYTTDIAGIEVACHVYGRYLFVNLGVVEQAPKFMMFYPRTECCDDGFEYDCS